MKHSIYSSAFLIFLLLSSPTCSARNIIETPPNVANSREVKGSHMYSLPLDETEEGSELMSLMGWEVCIDGDQECLRRRVVSEVHLDYIYTQQQKH